MMSVWSTNSSKIAAARPGENLQMTSAVLDTSALLAYVKGEPGADLVASLIGDAVISAVNFAEAVTKLVEKGATLDVARMALGVASIEVVDFDRALAERAGALVAKTKVAGLSLGDRSCLALAARERVPAVTGDRAWARLSLDVDVRLIR
jgi:PIN domain nuclease of toxin-antitoxin system